MSNTLEVGKVEIKDENAYLVDTTDVDITNPVTLETAITHIAYGLIESGAVAALNATVRALKYNDTHAATENLIGICAWVQHVLNRAKEIKAKNNAAAAAARIRAKGEK